MPTPDLSELAARLKIDLGAGVEPTKEKLLKAINGELGNLQVPETIPEQHERQVELVNARAALTERDKTSAEPSTDLVPISLVREVMEVFQKSSVTSQRADPSQTMRTNVKAASTEASADFTKVRSLPFAGAGALLASLYGLRTYFGVGDLSLPPGLFYPLFSTAAIGILVFYLMALHVQKRDNFRLRSLYNPDVQENALDYLGGESSDFFRSHSQRSIEFDEFRRAFDDGQGIILSRAMYQQALCEASYIRNWQPWRRSLLSGSLSTVDLEAAIDDATGLALDRLCDLKIIEPIVVHRRYAFRLIHDD